MQKFARRHSELPFEKLVIIACGVRAQPLSEFDAGLLGEIRFGVWFRLGNSRLVVRRFRYALDPVCLICCALYVLNRWGIKPHTHVLFFRSWFNDLLLIPCALPPLLQAHRWMRLRSHDRPPTAPEVFGHLAFWSLLFEMAGPHLMRGVTGDWRDAVAYSVGAITAFACWHRGEILAPLTS